MLLESVALAVLIGLLSGGKVNNLTKINLRRIWLPLFAFMLQFVLDFSGKQGVFAGWLHSLLPVIHVASYLFLFWFVRTNWRLPGMKALALGTACNFLVIAANGGYMPVDPAQLGDKARLALAAGLGTHGLLTPLSRFKLLADIIYISLPLLGKQLFSIGDALIDSGILILVIKTMRLK